LAHTVCVRTLASRFSLDRFHLVGCTQPKNLEWLRWRFQSTLCGNATESPKQTLFLLLDKVGGGDRWRDVSLTAELLPSKVLTSAELESGAWVLVLEDELDAFWSRFGACHECGLVVSFRASSH